MDEHSITYTGDNADDVLNWALPIGYRHDGAYPEKSEGFNLESLDGKTGYRVHKGDTLRHEPEGFITFYHDVPDTYDVRRHEGPEEGDTADSYGPDYRDDNLRALALDQAVRAYGSTPGRIYTAADITDAAETFHAFLVAGTDSGQESSGA